MATTNSLNNASAPFTVTSGNLAVSAGNITLPDANSGFTQGVVTWTSGPRIHNFGSDNIFFGTNSGNGTLTGSDNVFIGANTGAALTNGGSNMAMGANSLSAVTSGGDNVAIGIACLHNLSNTSYNVAVGTNALNATTGSSNTAIGRQALFQVGSGSDNACIGYQAGYNYTGTETNNICIGSGVTGTAAESNTIRIGNSSIAACFINGIQGVAVSNLNTVTINTVTGQLGSQAAGSGTVTSVSGTANQVSVANGTTTPVISLIGPYTPATYTAHGVLIGESTSSIVATAAGSAGQVLQSGGASADPTWSTATYPATAGTSGNVLTSNGTNWVSSASVVALFNQVSNAGNPSSSTTYYIASGATFNSLTATSANSRFYIPVAATVKIVYGTVTVGGTLASSGSSTVAVRKNDTTNTNVTTSLAMSSATNNFNNTGLSISVAAGDFLEFTVATPSWSTTPTSVKFSAVIYMTIP